MAKILIVDDDFDVVEACRMVLEENGHNVASACSRKDGTNLLLSFKPDLLILDVMMDYPDDGIAMAQDLRRQNFDNPIIMLSSVSRVTGLAFGRDNEMLPADEFLEKPVSPSMLVKSVRNLL